MSRGWLAKPKYSDRTRRATGDGTRQATVGNRAAPGVCRFNSRTCFGLCARKPCRPGSTRCFYLASGARLRASEQARTWHWSSNACASRLSPGRCIFQLSRFFRIVSKVFFRFSQSKQTIVCVLPSCENTFLARASNFKCPRWHAQPTHGNLLTSFGVKPLA